MGNDQDPLEAEAALAGAAVPDETDPTVAEAAPAPDDDAGRSPGPGRASRVRRGRKKTGRAAEAQADVAQASRRKLKRRKYEKELYRLQVELCRLQRWVQEKGLRVVVIFEGRDAAGKGGVIKRITERVSPRVFRVFALPAPSDRERSQFYFQRYITNLPSAGEIAIFDRSWYNRAGVERVMGFCTKQEYARFMSTVNGFESALVESGIMLVKYWFEVSQKEQERRFRARIDDPTKQWKLSPMDLESMRRWYDYSRAKDALFDVTDTPLAPWYVVQADDKRRARLNCLTHLLSLIPYKRLSPGKVKLPKRQKAKGYKPPRLRYNWVPQAY